MKRNIESKCRQKIINECNLNKEEQKELDTICKIHRCRYKLIYRGMPDYDNTKKLYIKKLFKLYPENDVAYSDLINLIIIANARMLANMLSLCGRLQ